MLHATDQKKGRGVALLASKENQLTTIKTSASNDIQVLTANCLSKNQCFVVTIVYKAPQTDILTIQNFLLGHFFVMGLKDNHILCGDLNKDFSKNDKTENFLREIGSLNLYLKSLSIFFIFFQFFFWVFEIFFENKQEHGKNSKIKLNSH